MRIIKTNSYEDMSRTTSQLIQGIMLSRPTRVNVSLTTGRTPHELFRQMSKEVKDRHFYDHVHYYNFEVMPHRYLNGEGIAVSVFREKFIEPANIKEEHYHIFDETNYRNQEERLRNDGGLDLVLMGVGADGHFGLNFPNTTNFKDFVAKVPCDARLKDLISSAFAEDADISDYYVTMCARGIMSAKHLIIFASGEEKADIVRTLLTCDISNDLPMSIMKMHPNVTLIVDKDAGKYI